MAEYNTASAAIVWNCIRKNSAFLHKRRGINKFFSSDKLNVTAKYTSTFSGLSNASGVSVQLGEDKKSVVVQTKKKKNAAAQKPVSALETVVIKGDPRSVIRRVGNVVKSYEPTLSSASKRRASQLLRSVNYRKRYAKKAGKA